MLVRPATTSDTDAVVAVHIASWKAGYRGILPDAELDAISVESRLGWWTQVLDVGIEGFHVLVVEDDNGRIRGFGSACPGDADPHSVGVDRVGEIAQLYLVPDAWGSGLAESLLTELEGDLRTRGFTAAELHVARGNARARCFYERCGWSDTGTEHQETVWGVEFVTSTYRTGL